MRARHTCPANCTVSERARSSTYASRAGPDPNNALNTAAPHTASRSWTSGPRSPYAPNDQMVADAEDAGLYDLPEVPFERLPSGDQ
jgi:hypothetical protein